MAFPRVGMPFPRVGMAFPRAGMAFPGAGMAFPRAGIAFPRLRMAFPRMETLFPRPRITCARVEKVLLGGFTAASRQGGVARRGRVSLGMMVWFWWYCGPQRLCGSVPMRKVCVRMTGQVGAAMSPVVGSMSSVT